MKDPQAVPALLEALKDEDETPVRFDPSVPVETIPVPDPRLTGLLEGKDYEVLREAATERLAERPVSYMVLRGVSQTRTSRFDPRTSRRIPVIFWQARERARQRNCVAYVPSFSRERHPPLLELTDLAPRIHER